MLRSWAVGNDPAQQVADGDEPASTCYLPERWAFVRRLAADAGLLEAAGTSAFLTWAVRTS